MPNNLTKQVTVEVTPEECAKLFCNMDNEEQCLFFNEIAKEVKTWKKPVEYQIEDIRGVKMLNEDAKSFITKLYEGVVL